MRQLFVFNDTPTRGKFSAALYFTILGYIISLYLKDCPVVTNLLLVLIVLLALVNTSPRNYFSLIKKDTINLGLILFFLIQVISILLSSDKTNGIAILQMRLPLLLLPLGFCMIGFEQKTWKKILLFYALATAIACLPGFIYGAWMAIDKNDSGYLYNDNISELFIGKQAVYMGFYVNAAILIFIDALRKKREVILPSALLYCCLAWLIFINFMLASKTSMISLLIILLLAALGQIIIKRKFMEGALLVLSLAVGCVVIGKIFPKTMNRFNGITQTDFQFDNKNKENHFNAAFDETKWNSTNTRAALWQCGMEIWKDHFLLGTGVGDKHNALVSKYKERNFIYALETEKNLHNQFLDIAVSMGLTGLIIFLLLFFVHPVVKLWKTKQWLGIGIFVCLAFCLFTENMLDRYQGEIIIAFLLPLAAKLAQEQEPAVPPATPGDTY